MSKSFQNQFFFNVKPSEGPRALFGCRSVTNNNRYLLVVFVYVWLGAICISSRQMFRRHRPAPNCGWILLE